MKRRVIVIVLAGVLGLAVGGVVAIAAAPSPPPPAPYPPYQVVNGQPVMSQLPAQVPVLDANGNVAGYVDSSTLFGGMPLESPASVPTPTPSPTKG